MISFSPLVPNLLNICGINAVKSSGDILSDTLWRLGAHDASPPMGFGIGTSCATASNANPAFKNDGSVDILINFFNCRVKMQEETSSTKKPGVIYLPTLPPYMDV